MENPLPYFQTLAEPRIERCKLHLFEEIIFLTICAVIAGADNFVEIESFGKEKKAWLQTFLKFSNGIPSHDTIGRLFSRINAHEFEKCFISWVQSVVELTQGQVIGIDGKTLRGSASLTNGQKAIHMVSAFANANGVVLGQVACEEKSNEITAIPALLDLIVVKGCIITIDAMGCQTAIAEKIIEQGADYILAVKDNQKKLHQEVNGMFGLYKGESFEAIEKDHGRIETRRCTIIANLKKMKGSDKWKDIKSVVKIESKQETNDKVTQEIRYYISSLNVSANKMNTLVREHWGIETKLHWVLDVSFKEDANRTRTDNAAENLSIVRRVAINLLKAESSLKVGMAAKRKAAGWNNEYLKKILKL